MFVLKFLLLSVLIVSSLQDSSSQKSDKLKVTVYYEVLCPDSIRFFTYQLYPTYKKIQSALEVDLVPYGKAIQNQDSNGHWEFDCQHGPAECQGNKVSACVLNQTLEFEVKMQVLNCMMSANNPSTAGKRCAERSQVPWDPIAKCASSELGDNLLAHYGDITHAADPKISFVPTITFNDKYDYDLQNQALYNFLATACKQIPADKRPPACNDAVDATVIAI